MRDEILGIPIYSREEFAAVLSMLPAPEAENPVTYDVFMREIIDAEQKHQRMGFVTRRVPMKASAIKAWCDGNDLPFCRASISKYVMAQIGAGALDARDQN